MATKKPVVKDTSRITIITNSEEECIVKLKGDSMIATAALAALMAADHEDNQFREMMALAIQVVLHEDKQSKKKSTKKKAAPKKKK